MRSRLLRILALPLAAVGTAAALVSTAGAADAASATITSGTGTVTVPASFLLQLARAGVTIVPQGAASGSFSTSTSTATVTFNATGGDAQVNALAGSVTYSGSLYFVDVKTGRFVDFNGLSLDMFNAQVDGTSSLDGSQQQLFDTNGDIVTSSDSTSTNQSYGADSLQVDPAGAAYLDSVLHTSVFTAGQVVGTFSTSYSY